MSTKIWIDHCCDPNLPLHICYLSAGGIHYLTRYNRVKYYNHVAHTELYFSLCSRFELCTCNIVPIERKNITEQNMIFVCLNLYINYIVLQNIYFITILCMWVRSYPLYSGKHVYSVIHVCNVTYTCTQSDIYTSHSGILG